MAKNIYQSYGYIQDSSSVFQNLADDTYIINKLLWWFVGDLHIMECIVSPEISILPHVHRWINRKYKNSY